MKVLSLSTSDIDGGAARASYRLNRGLRGIGVDSRMLVQNRISSDPWITRLQQCQDLKSRIITKLSLYLDQLPLKLYPRRPQQPWTPALITYGIAGHVNCQKPAIAHLHWISNGFLSVRAIASLNAPLVWTLHDMWAFTGGCHYPFECEGYLRTCGGCPQLMSTREWDLSRWTWLRKRRAWRNLDITIVTPSRWLAECAKRSSLFCDRRIVVIPNGLDTRVYRPIKRDTARQLLHLPTDRLLILFGAVNSTSSKRKGFQHLCRALKRLVAAFPSYSTDLVVFGSEGTGGENDFPFRAHFLGSFFDDLTLSLLYSAADVFVAPSIQDNLPNTVMEAMSCGTPCVAFSIGGMPDLIDHRHNGYLAQPFDSDDFSTGIAWILADAKRRQHLSTAARSKAETIYEYKAIAQRYLDLYQEILARPSHL